MKRILIFSTAYLPLQGGAELAVKEITERLTGDFSFDLICARIKKELPLREKIGAVEIWRVGRGWGKLDKMLFAWKGFRLAQRLYRQKNYDLVWAVMASFGGLAALFFKEQFDGVPYVLTLQEGDTLEHIRARARWLGPLYKRMFKKADLITTISHFLKNYARAQGAKKENIEVVPNGVDLNKFKVQSSKFKVEELKKKLGIREDEKVLITVSRLVEKNGVGDLIEAIKQLTINDQQLPIKLLILGAGPLGKKLKSKAEELGLKDKILFLGNVPNAEVPEYLAASDIFVRPSLAEGLGNAFLEAMACGVPIIGTKVGGIPDFLKDPSAGSGQSSTGLFCETKNPDDLARKIELLLKDEDLRRKLSENGRRLVEEKYDWKIIGRRMSDIFLKLINS